MSENEQWYTNKDLFEMVQSLRGEMQDTRLELQQTRTVVRQYNNLREQLGTCQKDILTLQQKTVGKQAVLNNIRLWGAVLIALGAFLFSILKG